MRSFVLARAHQENYPGVYHEVQQFLGEANTTKLIAQYGGCERLYIPVRFAPEHPLCLLLGQEVVQQLSDEFGGLSVEIPRAYALQIAVRNKLILSDKEAGMSQSELARKYRMTVRNIRKIIKIVVAV